MAIIEINKNPSRRDLIVFGLLFPVFTGLIGAGLYFRTGAHEAARAVWIAGVLVALLYFAVPSLRRPFYLGWIYVTYPIGYVLSHVILGAVFYLVFTPVGLVMRMLGKDPLHRRFDRAAATYWVKHDPHSDQGRYFRQS
ncbi:MAG TPA: SxtJ family membrane protein [Candidatus Limnocylindrales bacterium]|nr:SxtJ family membrane protein [Candidatus Limnocylindrales bacterium]